MVARRPQEFHPDHCERKHEKEWCVWRVLPRLRPPRCAAARARAARVSDDVLSETRRTHPVMRLEIPAPFASFGPTWCHPSLALARCEERFQTLAVAKVMTSSPHHLTSPHPTISAHPITSSPPHPHRRIISPHLIISSSHHLTSSHRWRWRRGSSATRPAAGPTTCSAAAGRAMLG
jgi:hypothetical protein